MFYQQVWIEFLVDVNRVMINGQSYRVGERRQVESIVSKLTDSLIEKRFFMLHHGSIREKGAFSCKMNDNKLLNLI